MASLRRLPNSPFWIARLTLPCGTRTNRSTKTSDRRLAQRLADEWQDAVDEAQAGRFVESQARRVLNDILVQAGEEPLCADTVESFLHRWLEGKGTGGTARRYSATVDQFLAHLGQKKQAFLCPTLAGRESGRKNGLSGAFLRILAGAGIDTRASDGKGIRRFSRLSFHSLRHSFNSALANQGVDQETRMALTGHACVAVNSDYTHLQLPKLKAAIERLPAMTVAG